MTLPVAKDAALLAMAKNPPPSETAATSIYGRAGLWEISDIAILASQFETIDAAEAGALTAVMADKLKKFPVLWNSVEMLTDAYYFYMDLINAGVGTENERTVWWLFEMLAMNRAEELGGKIEHDSRRMAPAFA